MANSVWASRVFLGGTPTPAQSLVKLITKSTNALEGLLVGHLSCCFHDSHPDTGLSLARNLLKKAIGCFVLMHKYWDTSAGTNN